jgi:hypothetical protein
VLWNIRADWAFDAHQRLGRWVVRQHHEHDLDVL